MVNGSPRCCLSPVQQPPSRFTTTQVHTRARPLVTIPSTTNPRPCSRRFGRIPAEPQSINCCRMDSCSSSTCCLTAAQSSRQSRTPMYRRSSTPRLILLCCFLSCLWHLCPSASSCVEAKPFGHRQLDHPYDPDESRLVGKFLHITDIHPDEHYLIGGSISSSCHRNTTDDGGDDDDYMRMLRPGRTDGGYGGKYGSPYSICDSPFSLSNATFAWIDKNLIGAIDFVVWTGDNAR